MRVMMIGAWSAALLGLSAPATAGDPAAGREAAGPVASNGWGEDVATADALGDDPSGAKGRVVVMTLSKPQPQPAPRTDADPGELSRHALSKRPPKKAD
jgi:hypothetical protein